MGCVLHILEDAFCGTVPFLLPNKRSVGLHVFHMSKQIGQMSLGEINFVLLTVLISLIAFGLRYFTASSFVDFLTKLWLSV